MRQVLFVRCPGGGHHHHQQFPRGGQLAQPADRPVAVHSRQPLVHQHQIHPTCLRQPGQRQLGGIRRFHRKPRRGEQVGEHRPVFRLVIHHQQVADRLVRHHLQHLAPDLRPGPGAAGRLRLEREPEPAACAGLARDGHFAAHCPRVAPTQRQPQSDAPAGFSAGLGLLENIEDALDSVGVDATAGVLDLHADDEPVPVAAGEDRRRHPHTAPVGKLHRVANQIHEDLAHLAGVGSDDPEHLRSMAEFQRQTPRVGQPLEHQANVLQ